MMGRSMASTSPPEHDPLPSLPAIPIRPPEEELLATGRARAELLERRGRLEDAERVRRATDLAASLLANVPRTEDDA
jgi:hypothetical protein